jgi:hypothetical protein
MARYRVIHARGTFFVNADYDKQAGYRVADEFVASQAGPPVVIEGPGGRLVVEFDGTEGDRDSIVEKRRG